MKNEELKRELVSSGRFDEYCKKRYILISNNLRETKEDYEYLTDVFNEDEFNKEVYCLTEQRLYKELNSCETYDMTWEECDASEQLRQSKKRQRNRLRKHLKFWLDNLKDSQIIVFGTMTFTDEDLNKLPITRKKSVQKALNEFCEDYIANVDYGKSKGREHYHFLGLCYRSELTEEVYYKDKDGKKQKKIKLVHNVLSEWSSKHGWTHMVEFKQSEKDIKRTTNYLAKLVNHSIKVKQDKLMVKKGTPYQDFKRERGKSDKDILQVIDEFENLLDSMNDMIASS